jgi:hypothetical protein
MAGLRSTDSGQSEHDKLSEIEGWYRHELTQPVEIPKYRYEPVRIGPTWQTEKIKGKKHWIIPETTLGWEALTFCGRWLQVTRDVPWRFTLEQARWVLNWYSVEPDGSWTWRDAVFQRLKGHGKDPLGACLAMFELIGPCRVGDWVAGNPVGVDFGEAWIQTAAVSLEQTKNTMRLLPGMVTEEAKTKFHIQVAKEQVYARQGTRFMQAVTSSPTTLEGARASFVLLNETHHWMANNDGHDMADVIERNAVKSPGGAARTVRITNAYEPGMDSVAERDREAWDKANSDEFGPGGSTGLLYDSLEASPQAPLTAEDAPEIINTIRGDSTWLHIPSIVASIIDSRNPPSRSRRFWYNQINAAEDAWMSPMEWDAIAAPNQLVLPDEPVVAFFDGSKSDDSTGLIGCRVSDGHVFRIGSWSKPPGERGKGWIVPRDEVDEAVQSMFESYTVKAFYADPSDTRDDEGERFWEPMIDDWHQRFGPRLEIWPMLSGERKHSISWDMRSRERTNLFTIAAQRFVTEVQDRRFTHDGSRSLRAHVLNARRRPNEWGVSLGKEHRESKRKIDMAVCAVGARMVRRLLLNKTTTTTKPRSGKVWHS